MNYYLQAFMGLLLIFAGTTLGSAFVFFFRKKEIPKTWNQICVGFAAGIMLSASFFSLLLPAIETEVSYMPSVLLAGLGVLLGALFLYLLDRLVPHLHAQENKEEGWKRTHLKKTTKMFLAVTLHNIPEGLSVGIAYGVSLAMVEQEPLALLSALALSIGIAIQNVPEGAIVSLSLKPEMGTKKAFFYGVFSGAVEPLAGLVGLLLAFFIQPLLPWALSFAAGAMLFVIVEEMVPDLREEPDKHYGVFAFLGGFLVMMVLDVLLG